MRLFFALVLVLIVGTSGPTVADQNDPRLDDLFARLSNPDNHLDAPDIQHEIWTIWMQSDDRRSNELLRLGVRAMQAGRHDIALSQFSALVSHQPDFAEGWNKRATVQYILGRYQESIADIKRVLSLEPRHFGALSGLGMCYEALGDLEAAVKAYELTLKANPQLLSTRERIRKLRREIRRKNI